MSRKPGNVVEFDSCQGNVGKLTKSLKCWKIVPGKAAYC